jgi:DNA-binding HxlR family transcriptional regulator
MGFWKNKKTKTEHIDREELQSYLNEMLKLGFIEITDYTSKGEPRYSITPLGRMELEFAHSE